MHLEDLLDFFETLVNEIQLMRKEAENDGK
jgi:hypothetical protein